MSERNIPIFILKNSANVYYLWKEKQFRGRIVINISKYLHFVPMDTIIDDNIVKKFSRKSKNSIEDYERNISFKNFLWVAMQGNIARTIYHVLPSETFNKILKGTEHRDDKKVKVSEDAIIIHCLGSRRIMMDKIPALSEPVLMNIDASFFSSTDIEFFVKWLRKSGLKVDMVTISLSEDNPDVAAEEREKLKKVSQMLLL